MDTNVRLGICVACSFLAPSTHHQLYRQQIAIMHIRQPGLSKHCIDVWLPNNVELLSAVFLQPGKQWICPNFLEDAHHCGRKLSLVGAATSIIFVATEVLSRQTHLLLQQKYACRDKTFVMTKLCLCDKFCCDKHTFVTTKDLFCRNKNYTCGSSRQ